MLLPMVKPLKRYLVVCIAIWRCNQDGAIVESVVKMFNFDELAREDDEGWDLPACSRNGFEYRNKAANVCV